MRGDLQGEEAISALGAQLDAVASHYRKSGEELRSLLRTDRTLRLDNVGRLYYVCEGLTAPVLTGVTNAETAASPALFALGQTFFLHSKPGSTKTIYLDFTGHVLSANAWTANSLINPGADIIAPPFDTDGNQASFSSAEQTAIQQIWFRVAEDYSFYDVDVTTEYPGEAAITRSSSGDQVYGTRALISAISTYIAPTAGGIAYVGVFDSVGDFNKPALIFPEQLANSEKNIAEAISHEVGHNLGLSHDGTTLGVAYYTGQGNWGPIMGVSYSRAISQWTKGEYANANNTEDDLVVMSQNGLVYRADDFGNSTGTATALTGVNITTNGIIEQSTDVDFFSFQTGGGTAQFTVTPWERGANLHLLLSIYDGNGVLLTNREVADTSAGVLPVAISRPLGLGNYYVSVEGIGSGDVLTTGYTDYANMGQYTLNVVLPGSSTWVQNSGGTFSWGDTANWLSGVIPNAADATVNITTNLIADQTITLDGTYTVGRMVLGSGGVPNKYNIADGSGGGLIFNVVSGKASLLKIGDGFDDIAATVSLVKELVVSNGVPLRISGPITGVAPLTKIGPGALYLAGANTFSGNTTVSNGALAIEASGSVASPFIDVQSGGVLDVTAAGGFTLAAGRGLSGRGAVVGDVSFDFGGTLAPGATNAPGTLTFSNSLTLAGGNLNLNLAPQTDVGGGTNDLVVVSGNLTLSGVTTINVDLLQPTLTAPGTYTVLTYAGTLVGNAANLVVTNSARYVITADTSTPGEIRLQVAGQPASVVWHGDNAANLWDVATTPNWFNGGSPDTFRQFDAVTITDAGSNSLPINLTTTVTPAAVTVSSTKNFTFGGAGKLSGSTGLTKLGTGTLTVNSSNDFSGATLVSAGQLKLGNAAALGDLTGGTTVDNSGVLDLAGLSVGAEPLNVSGAGAGSGALINSGAQQLNAVRFVTLATNATFGGSGRWDVRANPTAAFVGNGFQLTKVGANEIWLANLGATDLGDIEVRQGLLGIQGSTTLGRTTNALTLWTGTSLVLYDTVGNILTKSLTATNVTIRNDSGVNRFAGSATFFGSNLFNLATSLQFSGPLSGSGTIAKTGVGTLTLNGSNNLSGALYIDSNSASATEGLVRIIRSNSLAGGSAIFIRNNNNGSSTLQLEAAQGNVAFAQPITLSARNNSIVAVRSLSGSNTWSGNLALQTGGSNYLFQSDAGTFALTGTLPATTPGGTRVLTFQGAGGFLVAGLLQNSSGVLGITKTGTGPLIVTGSANSYSGLTTVSGGTLQLGDGGVGGKLGSGSVALEGLLQFNRSDDFTWANPVSGAAGRFIKLNTNTVVVTAANTFANSSAASAQVNGGTLQLDPGGVLVSGNEFWIGQNATTGACIINGGTLTVTNVISVGRNGAAAVGALTINSGTIQNYGTGGLTLGALDGTGTLNVNGGTVNLAGPVVLAETTSGKGFLNLNGGVLQTTAITKSTGASAVAKFNGGTLRATANNVSLLSGLNQTLIQTGGLILDDAGFGLTNALSLTEDAAAPGGGLTKLGSGTLAFTSANTFRGPTRVANGSLLLRNASALQFSTLNLSNIDSGTVAFAQSTITLGGLAGQRGLALTNSSGLPVAVTVGNNSSNTTYSGTLTGTGSVTKTGTGTLILNGGNTYAGATLVSAGVLGGNGSLAGPLVVQALGALAPGTGIGTFSVSNDVTLGGGFQVEISKAIGTNDVLNASGTLTLGGALVVTNLAGTLAAGDQFKILNASVVTGVFSTTNLPALNAGLVWQFSPTNGLLSVANSVAVNPTNITFGLVGNSLQLSWPADHLGWRLEAQTNSLAAGLGTNWFNFPGAQLTNQITLPIDATAGSVFYRLVYP